MEETYYNNILVPFDLLMDTDKGVLRVVNKKYNDKRYFNTSRIKDTNGEFLQEDILNFLIKYRIHVNPLYMITDEDHMKKEDIDDIYKQIIDEDYEEVLRLSTRTPLLKAFNAGTLHQDSPLKITVLCRNKMELEYLKELEFKCKTLLIKDNKDLVNIELKDYKYIYIKNAEDLLDFKYMTGKVIYIATYRFNMLIERDRNIDARVEVINPKFILDIVRDNKIMTMDIYPKPDNLKI